MRIQTAYIFLFSFLCLHAAAQLENYTRFTTAQGLSNNFITCIEKDSAGFLWVGTHEGLNRYDGTSFINILSNNVNNLPSNYISKICFIDKNIAAIATSGGLCLLNTKTLKGAYVPLPEGDNSQPGYYQLLYDLLYDVSKKELWAAGWNGIYVFNDKGKLLHYFLKPAQRFHNKTLFIKSQLHFAVHLFYDNQHRIFFYSFFENLFLYPDFEKNILVPVEEKDTSNTLNNYLYENFLPYGFYTSNTESSIGFSNNFYLKGIHKSSVAYFNTEKKTKKEFVIPAQDPGKFAYWALYNALPLNDSVFILNCYYGYPLLYNINTKTSVSIGGKAPLWFTSWPDGLPCLFYKDDENYWIGTSNELLQFRRLKNIFTYHKPLMSLVEKNPGIVALQKGIYCKNIFWLLCTGAGPMILDTASNKTLLFFDREMNKRFPGKVVATSLFNAGNEYWIGSLYGMVAIDKRNYDIHYLQGINKDASIDSIETNPYADSKGNIWLRLRNGISMYDTAQKKFYNIYNTKSGGRFPADRCNSFAEDDKNNIWFCCRDKLVKLNKSDSSFQIFQLKRGAKVVTDIYGLHYGGDSIFYCIAGESFCIYNLYTNEAKYFNKQTGIVSAFINGIETDVAGNAWLATEGGLVYYDRKRNSFTSFTKNDGLPPGQILSVNFADSGKTILFIGLQKTYCLVKPKELLQQKSLPVNNITGVYVNNKPIDIESGAVFSYNENNFVFHYTGISFNAGFENNYAYQLENYDKDWNYSTDQRNASYLNLSPGKYVFKMKAADYRGQWNENVASFSFEIQPPFWQTWWFRTIAVALVITAIYLVIKRREAALKKENAVQLQMSELKMQALQAQLNPHFIFNSLNSIQNYILSNDAINAAGYLSKFSALMRKILDQSKHSFIPLEQILETLEMYVELESFRFNKEFTYAFNISHDENILQTELPPMLLQPFAENAIIHGLMPKKGAKHLTVSVQKQNNFIVIEIDDNGRGRKLNDIKQGHISQGEKLTKGLLESMQQMQQIHAHLEITDKKENDKPAGTLVKIFIPLTQHI